VSCPSSQTALGHSCCFKVDGVEGDGKCPETDCVSCCDAQQLWMTCAACWVYFSALSDPPTHAPSHHPVQKHMAPAAQALVALPPTVNAIGTDDLPITAPIQHRRHMDDMIKALIGYHAQRNGRTTPRLLSASGSSGSAINRG
jgi:hypothetical protein